MHIVELQFQLMHILKRSPLARYLSTEKYSFNAKSIIRWRSSASTDELLLRDSRVPDSGSLTKEALKCDANLGDPDQDSTLKLMVDSIPTVPPFPFVTSFTLFSNKEAKCSLPC